MALNAPAIVTERMSKRYGSIQALVDLDLSVNHGKIPVSRSDGRYAERVCVYDLPRSAHELKGGGRDRRSANRSRVLPAGTSSMRALEPLLGTSAGSIQPEIICLARIRMCRAPGARLDDRVIRPLSAASANPRWRWPGLRQIRGLLLEVASASGSV